MRGEFLDLSGARLYYYAAGTRGAGVPVVFLHGFPTSSHLWHDVVPLMPPGHRIVVLDLLGFGRSDRPLDRPVDARAHANRLVALFDELRIERACIVGHAFGGGVAQAFAVEHPNRVSHLGLIDSAGFDVWPAMNRTLTRAALSMMQLLPSQALIGVLHTDLIRGFSDPERAGHAIDLYLRPFDCAEGRDSIAAHVKGISSPDNKTLASSLGTIAAPTSIVWGEGDRSVPASIGRRLAQAIPNATLDIIPGVRHFTPTEAPREIADAIQRLLRRTGTDDAGAE
jgi:pimeloyl-ACP methyl ester carboxylesterase